MTTMPNNLTWAAAGYGRGAYAADMTLSKAPSCHAVDNDNDNDNAIVMPRRCGCLGPARDVLQFRYAKMSCTWNHDARSGPLVPETTVTVLCMHM